MTESELHAAIVEQAPDAIIVADNDGRIRLWNHGAERLFGHMAAGVLGRSLDVIIPERLRQAHWDAFHRAIESRKTRYDGRAMTTRSMRRDGTTVYVDMSFALSLSDMNKGGRDAAFFLGSSVLLWLVWVASTGFGFAFGHLLSDPEAWGLDFLVPACFISMTVPLYQQRRSLVPWSVAAGASCLAWQTLPGASYLLVGAVAGALTGALLDERR